MYSTKVKDLMTRDIVAVSHDENLEKVAQLMVEKKIGSVLVHKDFEPIGIITKRDILEKVILNCKNPCDVPANDVATKDLITISSRETVREALSLMYKNDIKRIVVTSPDQSELIGIITTHDLVAAFNSLELS